MCKYFTSFSNEQKRAEWSYECVKLVVQLFRLGLFMKTNAVHSGDYEQCYIRRLPWVAYVAHSITDHAWLQDMWTLFQNQFPRPDQFLFDALNRCLQALSAQSTLCPIDGCVKDNCFVFFNNPVQAVSHRATLLNAVLLLPMHSIT